MWKEFGLSTTRNTIFPFWMFALVWAILSYAIASIGGIFLSTLSFQSVPQESNNMNNFMRPISSLMPNMENMYSIPAAAVATAAATATPMSNQKLPGYYIYDPAPQPRYVYYGPEPPTMGAKSS
jgi:hypothetical protein